MATDATYETYYVPADSKLPIFASLGIFLTVFGLGNWFNDLTAGNESSLGVWILFLGGLVMGGTLFVWFSKVIEENHAKMYSQQMNRSFVWGMSWFIFSEVMFFRCILWGFVLHSGFSCAMDRWRGSTRPIGYVVARLCSRVAFD
jgi:cytochrome c oxidase subunit 3